MRIEQMPDRRLDAALMRKHLDEQKVHQSSGRLTASALGAPLLFQILKVIGVPGAAIDAYALRKFYRGKQVENWFIKYVLSGVSAREKELYYQGVFGKADAIVDSKDYDFKVGVIPHEVKSVTNAKFRRVKQQGPDRQHQLQGCLYALGMGVKDFVIDYVSAEDFRTFSVVCDVQKIQRDVDVIIAAFKAVIQTKKIPIFMPRYSWQENKMYQSHPEWTQLSETQIIEKLKREYPVQYQKFVTLHID